MVALIFMPAGYLPAPVRLEPLFPNPAPYLGSQTSLRSRRLASLGPAQPRDGPKDIWDEGQQRWQLVVARTNNDDPERERIELLLRRDILIHREQHGEARLRYRGEQCTVLERRPPHLRDGLRLVTSQLTSETPRQVLIE
jgi:hypothetical protein